MSKSYQNCKRKLRKLTKRAKLAPREALLDLGCLSDQERAFTDKRVSEFEKMIIKSFEDIYNRMKAVTFTSHLPPLPPLTGIRFDSIIVDDLIVPLT